MTWTLRLGLAALLAVPCQAEVADTPEALAQLLALAHDQRDASQYEELLADDFVHTTTCGPPADRAEELATMRSLFAGLSLLEFNVDEAVVDAHPLGSLLILRYSVLATVGGYGFRQMSQDWLTLRHDDTKGWQIVEWVELRRAGQEECTGSEWMTARRALAERIETAVRGASLGWLKRLVHLAE